ncbi:MAG: hypothetical protein L0H53_00565 [Candidatus Nitrosocosmicus sp.]|nr:hypothetical protein [Candidatus Nitrosocosmicus sp.]MDN5866029.1 hypothetical protein [Candidatus Nitrosocosmicus sp.]
MKIKDDTQTTKQWLRENIKKCDFLYIHEKQLEIMAKVWDFLAEHEQYDYAVPDIRAELNYIYTQPSIVRAIEYLQVLGCVKIYRQVIGVNMYQVTTWRN